MIEAVGWQDFPTYFSKCSDLLKPDGAMLLEARWVPDVPIPERAIPPAAAERLMASETERSFGLADLERTESGHYAAPGDVHLNRKYVELLRGSRLKPTLRFRAKGPADPVLILDGETVVGVMMPVKS